MSNKHLNSARSLKNDEFYTKIDDIKKELSLYWQYFDKKQIYLPCDTEKSNFWIYFNQINYESYSASKSSNDFRDNLDRIIKADIIITNPPFSLFREFINTLIILNKKFIVIGPIGAIVGKRFFKLMLDNKIWKGYHDVKEFINDKGEIKTFGNICWWTNLPVNKIQKSLKLIKKYDPKFHLKYDNYNAINVNRIKDIPYDYYGEIGVPVSYYDYLDKNEYEILGMTGTLFNKKMPHSLYINGKKKYIRLFIKKIKKCV